jgi:hypothetical protein
MTSGRRRLCLSRGPRPSLLGVSRLTAEPAQSAPAGVQATVHAVMVGRDGVEELFKFAAAKRAIGIRQ